MLSLCRSMEMPGVEPGSKDENGNVVTIMGNFDFSRRNRIFPKNSVACPDWFQSIPPPGAKGKLGSLFVVFPSQRASLGKTWPRFGSLNSDYARANANSGEKARAKRELRDLKVVLALRLR